jgi:hypothetical protein
LKVQLFQPGENEFVNRILRREGGGAFKNARRPLRRREGAESRQDKAACDQERFHLYGIGRFDDANSIDAGSKRKDA